MMIFTAARTQDQLAPAARARPWGDHGSTGKIKLPPAKRTRKPAKRQPKEIPENVRTAKGFISTVGRKVAHADPEDLLGILEIERAVDNAMHVAVTGIRNHSGRSDAEIAKVLGITRQAVSQRFPRAGGRHE